MAKNPDGTATCDRCGIWLAGYGVLYGMVCTDLDATGGVRDWIFCYTNNCRSAVLSGMVLYPSDDNASRIRCYHCNMRLDTSSVAEAMLTFDLAPATIPATVRTMTFCYINGSRDQLLAQAVL